MVAEGEPKNEEAEIAEEEEAPAEEPEKPKEEEDEEDEDDEEPEKKSKRVVKAAVEKVVAADTTKETGTAETRGEKFLRFTLDNPTPLRVPGAIIASMVAGLLKFAKEIITKKGKVGFGKGYEFGKETWSFDTNKKGKK